jgi:hypothetical protein
VWGVVVIKGLLGLGKRWSKSEVEEGLHWLITGVTHLAKSKKEL